MIIKVFIVNLRESTSRRIFMERQLKKLGLPYEFVRAVGSNDIDNQLLDKVNSREIRGGPMSKSEIACALSHKKACMTLARDRDCDLGIVLEDDVILRKGFGKLAAHFSEERPESPVTLLYAIAHSPVYFERASYVVKPYCLVHTLCLTNVWGAQAYLLHSSEAAHLAESTLDVYCRADDWAFHVDSGAVERLGLVFPFPALHAEFNSDINGAIYQKRPPFSRGAISGKIHRRKIFPLFQISLFFRRLRAKTRQRSVIFVDGQSPKKNVFVIRGLNSRHAEPCNCLGVKDEQMARIASLYMALSQRDCSFCLA